MNVIFGLITIAILAIFNALPLAFVGMLFLGSLGFNLSFGVSLLGALSLKFIRNDILSVPTKN